MSQAEAERAKKYRVRWREKAVSIVSRSEFGIKRKLSK